MATNYNINSSNNDNNKSNIRPLTISLQNLHTLYCKFIEQNILQHIPKHASADVSELISMKSAIDAYKFLDSKLSLPRQQDIKSNNANNFTKIPQFDNTNSEYLYQRQHKRNLTQKNTISQQSDKVYAQLEEDRGKRQTRINSLLKRAHTYVQQPASSEQNNNRNNYKFQPFSHVVLKKQQSGLRKQQSILKKQQSFHERNKSNTKNISTHSDKQGANFYRDKQKLQSISDLNKSEKGSYNKIQLSKTYSSKETNQKIKENNIYVSSKHTTLVNTIISRSRLVDLLKQTKQIFADNAKKILRYENLSSDLACMQKQAKQQKNSSKSQNNINNQEAYKFIANNSNSVNSNNGYSNSIGSGKNY